MKKLIVLFVILLMTCPAIASDIDLSSMSDEDLKALKMEVDLELYSRENAETITLYKGVYVVGSDIEPGSPGTITFKKEGAGANRKMYVDGVEQISMSDFAGTFEGPSVIFGANVDDNGTSRRYLHADLSDMTIKLKYTYAEIQQLFSNLPNPTHTGYAFGGWYTAQVGGTRVTSSTPITLPVTQSPV